MLSLLGEQLRRLRIEQDLTQQELAGKAGLSYKYLGRIELAQAEPGADILVRLARALAVPVGELFETITPSRNVPHHLSPADLEEASTALRTLTAIVDRVRKRNPRPVSRRASRRSRR